MKSWMKKTCKTMDNNGNTQNYTLDADNDQPTNITTNSNSVLNNVKNQVFDKMGRLTKTYRNNVNEYNYYEYDNNSNVSTARDANGNTKNYRYTSLDQVQSTSGRDGSPDYTYDLDGNLKTASLNYKTTTYHYNDFGEMTSLISPETGTQTMTYDITQNLMSKTDAKGVVSNVTSEILGRVKTITHTLGATTETETFTYDSAVNGIGKIATVTNSSNGVTNTIAYEYNALGRMSKKTQTVGSITKAISYAYNSAGQMSSMTYPTGLVVNYIYTKGLITSVTVSGAVVGTVLDTAIYHPFDSSFPKGYRFNTNKNKLAQFDINEKLISMAIDGVLNNTFSMDGVGNYLSILDSIDTTKSIVATYDTNNKISNFTQNNQTFQPNYDYGYNRTGSSNGITGQNMSFNYDSTTNRLNSYTLNGTTINLTYDNNGNTLTEGLATYTYDLRNNLTAFSKSGVTATYGFNGLGQRTVKTTGGVTNYFLYDESANLIGEYDQSGSVISEHIYLNGVPVGLIKANTLYYVHTDQTGTPRSITNNANSIVWKWNNTDPFGGNLPNVSTVTYNKRFPGQYFDNESKLHYNYYRTYNPLGLAAGFNTYSYVGSNPLGAVDPMGLDKGIFGSAQDNNSNTRAMESAYKNDGDDPKVYILYAHGVYDERDKKFHIEYDIRSDFNKKLANPLPIDPNGEGEAKYIAYINSAETLLKQLKEGGVNINKYDRIELRICNMGQTKIPQDLANQSKKLVMATKDFVVWGGKPFSSKTITLGTSSRELKEPPTLLKKVLMFNNNSFEKYNPN